MDFSTNPRLRNLIFDSLDFDNSGAKQYVLSTLRTAGNPLESVTFDKPSISASDLSDAFFKEFDSLFSDNSVFRKLNAVCFDDSGSRTGDLAVRMEKWLPRLHHRGILFVNTRADG